MPETELEVLRAENVELRRRVEAAEADIDTLRRESLERRAEVRRMAEALPAEVSRRTLLRAALYDVRRHPDKRGVAARAARKAGRAPVKLIRIARDR